MRKYSYGINNYHKTASIIIEDAHWWVFFTQWLFGYICWLVPSIPFPNLSIRLRDKDSIEFNGGDRTTLREWWGDLNSWFHLKVHQPILDFCWARTDDRLVDINYDKLKQATIKYDKLWEEHEQL